MKKIEDPATFTTLISLATYGVLSMTDKNMPYAVPMNFARKDNFVFLHSGLKGKKLEVLRVNPNVLLTLVPEAEFVMPSRSEACGASMHYSSVHVFGQAEVLDYNTQAQDYVYGLECLKSRYGLESMPMDERLFSQTAVIRMNIQNIFGRQA